MSFSVIVNFKAEERLRSKVITCVYDYVLQTSMFLICISFSFLLALVTSTFMQFNSQHSTPSTLHSLFIHSISNMYLYISTYLFILWDDGMAQAKYNTVMKLRLVG